MRGATIGRGEKGFISSGNFSICLSEISQLKFPPPRCRRFGESEKGERGSLEKSFQHPTPFGDSTLGGSKRLKV
ncbi:MAG: hypothetical protein C6I01_00275 [Epsilonproteobacteria bacterium]|nr:hypothetical protein [Campylobacterota bacterium]